MKILYVIFLTGIIGVSNFVIFQSPVSAATTYTLKSPVPGVVNAGAVSEGVSTCGSRIMWKDGSNQMHLLATFGGDEKGGWYADYINMSTGHSQFVTGAEKGCINGPAYNPVYNKLYAGTGYATNEASLTEFDPVTGTLTKIADKTLKTTIGGVRIGGDNRVYYPALGNNLYSYDPGVGMPNGWKDYGVPNVGADAGSNYNALGIDTTHIYFGLKRANGTWTLVTSPVSGNPSWTEWEFGNAGDTALSIGLNENHTEHVWTLARTLANGDKKYYRLQNGNYVELTPGQSGYAWSGNPPFLQGEYHQGRAPWNCVSAGDENSYPSFASTYGWEADFEELFPFKGVHEYSTVKYRQVGAQKWNELTFPFKGPWVPQLVQTIQPLSGSNIFGVTGGYNAVFNLDYKTPATEYLGPSSLSPYESMKHSSGEIYIGGYSNRVLRYDPTKPWTLTSTNTSPKLPSDANKPNPYVIQMPAPLLHYRHGMDYDANGIVWIGGNTTRGTTASPDYGNVMWYNPADGSTGYMFPDWKTSPTIFFRNLTAAANRTKIVVASNDGILTVINAATKTVDGTYNLGEYAYMADVDGVVVGVTPGGKIFRFNPLTRTMLTPPQSIGVSGTPFGFGNGQYSRMSIKLEKGPDNFLWMFVGNTLYRINPNTLAFTKVLDTTFAKIKFAANNTDLLLYGNGTDFKYIPGILVASQAFDSADLNSDNLVNLTDFNILKSDFLKLTASLANPKSDIDGDGQATIKDVGILMGGWK